MHMRSIAVATKSTPGCANVSGMSNSKDGATELPPHVALPTATLSLIRPLRHLWKLSGREGIRGSSAGDGFVANPLSAPGLELSALQVPRM